MKDELRKGGCGAWQLKVMFYMKSEVMTAN